MGGKSLSSQQDMQENVPHDINLVSQSLGLGFQLKWLKPNIHTRSVNLEGIVGNGDHGKQGVRWPTRWSSLCQTSLPHALRDAQSHVLQTAPPGLVLPQGDVP